MTTQPGGSSPVPEEPPAGAVMASPGLERMVDFPRTSVGLISLTDLGTGSYQGFQGGLYPGGTNEPPAAYRQIGIARARAVQPLNQEGIPAAAGAIVLLGIGFSNTTQEFSAFKLEADRDSQKNPRLVIVDGAQGGQDALQRALLEHLVVDRVERRADRPSGETYGRA